MLSRSWRRSPREGASFTELVSFLAGEGWGENPSCTHVALTQLAQLVNDFSSDGARPQLARWIPAVIGQRDLGDAFAQEIALLAAIRALPLGTQEEQCSMALAMLQIIGEAGEYRPEPREFWRTRTKVTLAQYSETERWARRFVGQMKPDLPQPSVATGLTVVAVMAIAGSPNGDGNLRELLAAGIKWAHVCSGTRPDQIPPLEPSDWEGVVAPAEPEISSDPRVPIGALSEAAGDALSIEGVPPIDGIAQVRAARGTRLSTGELLQLAQSWRGAFGTVRHVQSTRWSGTGLPERKKKEAHG